MFKFLEKAGRMGCSPGILKFPTGDWIVGGVRQYYEAFLDEDMRCFKKRLIVWKKRFLVSNHLKLDPIREPGFSSEPCCADSVIC